MTNGITPFTSNKHVEDFATRFLADQINYLRKNVGVCLTSKEDGKHAYFPALISCIAFVELLSSLHAGRLRNQGVSELVAYARSFMDPTQVHYDPFRLAIMYEAFRHKVAHLGHPYVVFDTSTMTQRTRNQIPWCQMRLAWTVSKRRGHYMPIEIRPQKSYLKRTPTPWTISYDHRIHISIEHIRVDSIRSVTKQGGYLDHLKSHQAAKDRFAQCMVEYYPR